MTNSFVILLTTSLLVLSSANTQDLSHKISITLTADRDSFFKWEDLWFEITVKNLLNEQITIPDPSEKGSLLLRVFDSKRQEIPRGIIDDHYGKPNQVTLPPRGMLTETISGIYSNDTTGRGRPGGGLVVGGYQAQAFLGDIESNVFEFRIVEPPPEEQIVAQKIVDQLVMFTRSEHAIRDAKLLLQQYPHSIYTPNIYSMLLIDLKSSNDPYQRTDELMSTALEFIQKFPNSGWAKTAIAAYVTGIRRKLGLEDRQRASTVQWASIENKLNELRNKYPHERLTRYIDQVIKSQKEWEAGQQ